MSAIALTTQGAEAAGALYLTGPMPRFTPENAAPNGAFTPAPVPRLGIAPPRTPPPKVGEPELSGSLRPSTPQVRSGEGYAPGSSFNEELQRKNRSATGSGLAPMLQFSVPMEN